MDKQKLEAIKVALAALDTLACNPNHANRQEVALDGWNALHDAFGQEPDGGSGREPMSMDRYQEANAAFRIDGYYSPPPMASAVPAAFEAARTECLRNMRADVERVERLTWEQFIRGRKDRPSWWGRCEPNTELDEANDEITGMRQDWQKVGEALGFKDFVDPEVIIGRVREIGAQAAAAPGSQALQEFIVLYREIDGDDDDPFGFSCWAENSDHAEEQCRDAQEGIELVWVFEGNSLEEALESYRSAGSDEPLD